jgi:hypothetical protein
MELNKWCQPHWDTLREAIFAKGMKKLVPTSGQAAIEMLQDELRVGTNRDVEGFDPLMRAYWAISSIILKQGGNPFDCPLCQLQQHEKNCKDPSCKQTGVNEWIESCTNAMREYCIEKKLL